METISAQFRSGSSCRCLYFLGYMPNLFRATRPIPQPASTEHHGRVITLRRKRRGGLTRDESKTANPIDPVGTGSGLHVPLRAVTPSSGIAAAAVAAGPRTCMPIRRAFGTVAQHVHHSDTISRREDGLEAAISETRFRPLATGQCVGSGSGSLFSGTYLIVVVITVNVYVCGV